MLKQIVKTEPASLRFRTMLSSLTADVALCALRRLIPCPDVIKNSMLNAAKHESFPAHEC